MTIAETKKHLQKIVGELQQLDEKRIAKKAYRDVLEDHVDLLSYRPSREEINAVLAENSVKSVIWTIGLEDSAYALTEKGRDFFISNIQPYVSVKILEADVRPENSDNILCMGSYWIACDDGFTYEVEYDGEVKIRDQQSLDLFFYTIQKELDKKITVILSIAEQGEKTLEGDEEIFAVLGIPQNIDPNFKIYDLTINQDCDFIHVTFRDNLLSSIGNESIFASVCFNREDNNFGVYFLFGAELSSENFKDI